MDPDGECRGGVGPPGWVFHYREDDGWYKQLVAERYVSTKNKKGFTEGHWHKSGRNEALDTANYARAAAEHLGISKWGEARLKTLEDALDPAPTGPTVKQTSRTIIPPSQPPEKPKAAGGSWVRGNTSGWFNR